ncbi:conserved hypothetical protein [Alteracholeplasma palmae J233]|uniref:Uncharacterized protein n=1 Tax=Alteracholeplasma palmae (strain ATCC 49389 / J233) TaxID=1318466 RepID=U4KLP9_ALTPJ|nr:hypothetical protein [Alteracholeplasma palmae]CCV64818.1 conserved hypothetical protein [Alteracholeplasma palmae J233]
MKKGFKAYAVATQIIATLLGGGILGLFIAKVTKADSTKTAIYAGVGLVIGLFSGMVLIYQYIKTENIYEKRRKEALKQKEENDEKAQSVDF